MVGEMRQEMELEMDDVSIADVAAYSFTLLSARYADRPQSHLATAVQKLYPELLSGSAFEDKRASIAAPVRECVNALESERKKGHSAFRLI
jgi:hypothetical protein